MNSSSIRERKIRAEAVFIHVLVWQNLHSSQSTTNHKLQEAGLQWRNDFQKAFAHCRDCVQLNYLQNWTLWAVPVSIITQVDTFYYYLLCYRGFFSVTSANVWVVLVNFWLGLAYHTEETSSYTDTGKIWNRSNHVRVHVDQEESLEYLLLFLAAHFLPSDFIPLSDRYLDNTSFQIWGQYLILKKCCIFGCKQCSTTVSVVLNCEQDEHKWDIL